MKRLDRVRLSQLLASFIGVAMLAGVACSAATSSESRAPGGATSPSSGKAVPPVSQGESSSPAPGAPGYSAQDGAAAGAGGSAPSPLPPTVPSANALERPRTPSQNGTEEGQKPAQGQQQAFDRMIIYTTSIALTVKDVPAAVEEVSQLASGSGGYVSGSTVRQEGERTLATVTIRVPAQGYAEVMSSLRRMGVKVDSENGKAQDVTEEFADLEAQVRNLEVTEEQLRALMAKATTIDEIIRVQTQISNVRGQIERLKGRMVFLQRNAELATITVSLQPETPGRSSTTTSRGWEPLRIAEEAWNASLEVLQALATVGIRVLVFSWWLIPVFAVLVMLLQSRLRRTPRAETPAP